MANVSSSSSTSTTNNAYSSHGLSGFASGLDTESMVQAMLQSTQNRIDKQNQKITKLEWTQSIYRDVIKQVQAFQSKYFSYASATSNLKSNSFWNTMKVASSNAAVSVVNKSATTNSNMSINAVKKLATAATLKGKPKISGGISLDLAENAEIKTGDGVTPITINVSLDGVSKTIELSGSNAKEIQSNLDASLKKVFGNTVSASYDETNKKLNITTSTEDHVVKVTAGSSEAKDLFNMTNETVSNKIVLNSSISSLSLGESLNGTHFEFEINGTTIEVSASDSLNEIINKVNSSDAGVTMSYDTLSDSFVLKASYTGADIDISVKDTKGNLMNLLMGAGSANSVGTAELESKKTSISGGNLKDVDVSFEYAKSFVMTVDGKETEYTISSAEDLDDLLEQLNDKIQDDYKDVSLSTDENGNITFSGGDHEITLGESKDGSLNELLGFATNAKNYTVINGNSKLSDILGVESYSFTINGVAVTGISADTSVDDLIVAINNAVVDPDSDDKVASIDENGKITINAGNYSFVMADSGDSGIVKGLFGTSSVDLTKDKEDVIDYVNDFTAGQNAKLVVNGQEIERNSNSFELDGLQITLNSTYNEAWTEGTSDSFQEIDITSTKNTETIVTTIKEFVTAYNEMMTKVNDLINESTKDLKKYPPLTEAQKKEMTEKEIELWEEKAKVGLLANDSLLTSMKSSFRGMLYSKVEGGLALYDIGITTNTDGTLKVDDSKLQAMVETEGSRIAELFTDSEKGIAIQMDNLCNRYAKQSIANPGILVQRAGVKNSSTENQNYISRQIQDLQNYLKRLQSQYDDRKSRYWKQFTSLETLVSNSNATSSYLSNMFTY